MGYHNIKISRDGVPADSMDTEPFADTLKAVTEKGGYFAKQIFDMGKAALLLKKMPAGTNISWEEITAPSFKASKNH